MNLLPRTHQEFGSKDYWEKFFRKRGSKAFEWYGDFAQLCSILSKYIRPSDSILVAGCGNSELSADLYDVGYHSIVNVDISATVIQQMAAKHGGTRPDMKYLQMDLLDMSFGDGEFSVVLDKGTVDAIFTDTCTEVVARVDKLISEVQRVLRIGGRFVCITLAQEHIVSHVVQSFANEGWMVRVCRAADSSSAADGREFQLPVFVMIFTKFRKLPNMKPILELAYFEDKPERFETVDALLDAVRELQRYAIIRQQLHSGGRLDEQLSLDLYSSSVTTAPRYTVHVVDGPRTLPLAKKFAIFVVPQGREMEWLFSTDEGRLELHRSAGYERLLVVTLHREHVYNSLDDIKAELSEKVLELAPANVAKQSPFLSLGEAVNVRSERYRGTSAHSGEFVVEDVDVGGETFRRLIFLANKNLVQSEARLMKPTNRKRREKGEKKKRSEVTTVDVNYLMSNYYGTIVAGLVFVDDLQTSLDTGLEILLIGLGGGGLAMYLHNNIPKVKVGVVEIDPEIITVATNWFGFTADDRLTVDVADGLEFVGRLSAEGSKRDVIILDVDSKDHTLGMSCPPPAFVDVTFLQTVSKVLKPSGVLMLNLVCRSRDQREVVLGALKSVFGQVYSVKVPEDVNETVYCLPATRPHSIDAVVGGKVVGSCSALEAPLEHLQKTLESSQRQRGTAHKDTVRLSSKLEKLRLL